MTTNTPIKVEQADSLRSVFLPAVLHGDEQHRAWLTAAVEAFIAGDPIPPPIGKATHEAIRHQAYEEAAKVARCHADDRPRRDGVDWNDGYMDGCRGAADAIEALTQAPADDGR